MSDTQVNRFKAKVLVVGKTGQLAKALSLKVADDLADIELVCAGRPELDITDKFSAREAFILHRPDYVINAAAYTQVDQAEVDEALAFEVNSTGVRNLAELSKEYGSQMIHISTDYVYDGVSEGMIKESDPTNPLNAYGRSKLEGELEGIKILEDLVIVRTGWVYGGESDHFVSTMLRLGSKMEELKVVSDQYGRPTYVGDLADALIAVVRAKLNGNENSGVYHFTNAGEVISWYDFALEVFENEKSAGGVVPERVIAIPSLEFGRPAKRPSFAGLDLNKIVNHFGINLRDWKLALDEYLNK